MAQRGQGSDHFRASERATRNVHRELCAERLPVRRWRDYGAMANVEFADASIGSGIERGRRGDHGSLRRLQGFLHALLDVPFRSGGRRDDGTFHLRRRAREICDAGTTGAGAMGSFGSPDNATNVEAMRHRAATEAWVPATMVCERLLASGGSEITGCAEYSRIGIANGRWVRTASVERRQIFRGRVVDDIGVRERGLSNDAGLEGRGRRDACRKIEARAPERGRRKTGRSGSRELRGERKRLARKLPVLIRCLAEEVRAVEKCREGYEKKRGSGAQQEPVGGDPELTVRPFLAPGLLFRALPYLK